MHNINYNSVHLIYKYSAKYLEYFVRVWTLCAARCFVKKKHLGFCCLNVNFYIYIYTCLCIWLYKGMYFVFSDYISASVQPGKPPFNCWCPVHLFSDLQKRPKSKYPLPAFLHVRAELNMHLLPVANCEWNAFDIMRRLVLYSCVQAHSQLSDLLNSVGLFFTAL